MNLLDTFITRAHACTQVCLISLEGGGCRGRMEIPKGSLENTRSESDFVLHAFLRGPDFLIVDGKGDGRSGALSRILEPAVRHITNVEVRPLPSEDDGALGG